MMPNRPVIMAARHAVSTGHYLATQAGFAVLEAGGNAVDAGVAAGLVLGVVQSDIVNVAGVAPMIIWRAETGGMTSIDGLGTWPAAVTPDLFQREHEGRIPEGLLRTVVPAAPHAWLTALARYGTMSLSEVAAPAIRLATEGFAMFPLLADNLRDWQADYARWPSSAAIYLPGGRPPEVGELFVQADLGRSLQYMVDEEAVAGGSREDGIGAARDAFYKGDIARAIARFHAENGGLLSEADLAGYACREEPTCRIRFAGIEVHSCGPWSQGPALPQSLAILADDDLAGLGHNSPAYIHRVVEALKLAFADRERHYGDPRFVDVPIEALLSPDYARARRKLIDDARAWPEMPPAGDPGTGAAVGESATMPPPASGASPPPHDTSYVCVVDRWGNAFSATPSDVSRDTPVIPGTGLCPSSRGSQSWANPAHPSSVAPGKRPRLTPNPALALKDGRPFLVFGSPGGDVQTQAMLQVFLNVVVFGMDVQSAVEAPRFASFSFPISFEPHEYHPGRLNLEARLPEETGAALAALGHEIEWWPERTWRAGSVCLIRPDHDAGILHAGADFRRAGYALGW
ncbi:MAG TPA: gamma-glutamyltransferase family protein [Thermohalobaculum sp.]|nr:gamma-glutamyltransferase family protein [Thermohalobaculum sp.]